ncbi:Uncharacterized protein conserved in bacteria [Mycobacteroides abscessus subsp. abscessus]|nr:Uncharacterized protein conserved in bacteria [Mycobacteroides abscessus subsp. abscessus]
MMTELALANARRTSLAADQRVAQARRALEVLKSYGPHPTCPSAWLWVEVLQLRVKHSSASLSDLAGAMAPPMTKDRYSALLRRACLAAERLDSGAGADSVVVPAAASAADSAPGGRLTASQIEILRKFGHDSRWLRSFDLGGARRSNHSDVLAQLVRLGLVESKARSAKAGSKRLYRITAAGAHARHFPRTDPAGPLAALVRSAADRHGGASDRQLAMIAQKAGHKVSHGVLSRLRQQVDTPEISQRGAASDDSLRAIAFLARVPEPVVYEAAGVRVPSERKQVAAETNRRFQRDYLIKVQKRTRLAAVNGRSPWTPDEDRHMLDFMETPGARIVDLALELGRSYAAVTNRLRKLRSKDRRIACASDVR